MVQALLLIQLPVLYKPILKENEGLWEGDGMCLQVIV